MRSPAFSENCASKVKEGSYGEGLGNETVKNDVN
jgi:hypothetical protein